MLLQSAGKKLPNLSFQLKECGQLGAFGVLAQGLAILTSEAVQCFTMEICLAQEPQVKQETARVRKNFLAKTTNPYIALKYDFLFLFNLMALRKVLKLPDCS